MVDLGKRDYVDIVDSAIAMTQRAVSSIGLEPIRGINTLFGSRRSLRDLSHQRKRRDNFLPVKLSSAISTRERGSQSANVGK